MPRSFTTGIATRVCLYVLYEGAGVTLRGFESDAADVREQPARYPPGAMEKKPGSEVPAVSNPGVFTIAHAAALLGIPKTTLYDLTRRGELAHARIGRRIYIPAAAVNEIIGNAPPAATPVGAAAIEDDLAATITRCVEQLASTFNQCVVEVIAAVRRNEVSQPQ